MTLNGTPETALSNDPRITENPIPGPRAWAGLAVLALPTFLLGLDVTLLYLALPALAEDLQPSSTQALWIMDIYGFMIAGFLITMGTLGDRIGRRRLLMIGALAFGGASLLAAFSTSAAMLIFARALLGLPGATLMPSTLALISNMFGDARQRALAIGVWATMFALGMAAGPMVGGMVLDHFWWGAAFLSAVPVIVFLLVTGPFILPEHRAPQGAPLDLLSVLFSLAAILLAIYGVKSLARDGSGIEALAGGLVLAVVFVRRQHRLTDPLLDMTLFTSRTFSAALIVLLMGLVGVSGIMLLVTQYLQLVAELPPLRAGIWMGLPALAMVAAGVAAPLIARVVRPAFVVAGALLLSALGYLLLAQLDVLDTGITRVLTGFSLVYLGLGTIAALGTDLVVGAAPTDRAGSASAMSEMVQELGVALGVAMLGSLATFVYSKQITEQIPDELPGHLSDALTDSLWATSEVAHRLPDTLLAQAKASFIQGLSVTATVGGLTAVVLALISAAALRHVGVLRKDG